MTAIQKRIINILLIPCAIVTIIAYGSCIVCDYSLAKQGISIEAILEGK